MNANERANAKRRNFVQRIFYNLCFNGKKSLIHELRDSANVLEDLGSRLENNQMFDGPDAGILMAQVLQELSALSRRVELFATTTAENVAAYNALEDFVED